MRILTYKRTHTGDPDKWGRFGINDCMGRVRALRYDAVIGVGGIGREPKSYGIDRKITWVGIDPRRKAGGARRAEVVEFQHFILFDQNGPFLHSLAPNLARKIYGRRRYILDAYSETEKAEAIAIVDWARNLIDSSDASVFSRAGRRRCKTVEMKKRCRKPPNTLFQPTP